MKRPYTNAWLLYHASRGLCRWAISPYNPTILNLQHTIRGLHDRGIMGSHEQPHARIVGGIAQQIGDGPARQGVQIAGWLVSHDEARRVHQRACQGHALLFATGEFEAAMVRAGSKPHLL